MIKKKKKNQLSLSNSTWQPDLQVAYFQVAYLLG